jgi:xylulose-5-phosphate/fructose-6-phosphate phosphoketolase
MLLGHWGTTPGQNFIYVHLNRVIKKYDLDMIYVSGPGHGGPAVVATPIWRAPTARSIPTSARMRPDCKSSFSSFRFPAAFPAMPRRSVPARFTKAASWAIPSAMRSGRCSIIPIDRRLRRRRWRGGNRAAGHGVALQQVSQSGVTDGAVLPILHLNGYKIANPTILARMSQRSWSNCCAATAGRPITSRARARR